MPQRGGKRPGAGRPKGSKDKATREQGATLGEMARTHTELALKVLADVALKGESEAARVSAANAILDRGYGRPSQAIEHSGQIATIPMDSLTDEQLAVLEAIGHEV
jgi:hypothetical protein